MMKRLSCILGVAMVATFASCSTDDYDNVGTADQATKFDPNYYLVKKVQTSSEGGATVTEDQYFYNGKKLLKVVSTDGREIRYTYSNDLIVERDFYVNGTLNSKEQFDYYKSNQLIGFKRLNAAGTVIYKATYTSNADGTVSVRGLNAQNVEILNRKVFFSGTNVYKIESYSGSTTEVLNYNFDGKNSPFRNIVGFDKLTYYDVTLNGNSSNVVSVLNGSVQAETVQYAYNAADFPTNANKGSVSFQYTY